MFLFSVGNQVSPVFEGSGAQVARKEFFTSAFVLYVILKRSLVQISPVANLTTIWEYCGGSGPSPTA